VAYTAAQATRLAGCTPGQLRYWSRAGIVTPAAAGEQEPSGYGFRDLVVLRVTRALLDAGLPLARVRAALAALGSVEQIAGLRLLTDGERVWACRDDGEILDALRHGQLCLFVAVDRYAAAVADEVAAFEDERAAFVAGLRRTDPDASGESSGAVASR